MGHLSQANKSFATLTCDPVSIVLWLIPRRLRRGLISFASYQHMTYPHARIHHIEDTCFVHTPHFAQPQVNISDLFLSFLILCLPSFHREIGNMLKLRSFPGVWYSLQCDQLFRDI